VKILFLTAWYPTETNSGFGIFIKEHAKAIQTAGNEIVVLAIVIHRGNDFWKKTIKDFVDENGIRTILIEITTRFRDIAYHAIPLQYWVIKRTFNKLQFNPDIVHSNVIFPVAIAGSWLAKKFKKPHIVTEHFTRVSEVLKIPLVSHWAKQTYRKTVCILPVSNYLKENLIELIPALKNHNFQVIPNVIDEKLFFHKEKEENPDTIKLCSVAAWNKYKKPAKQPELFIDAVSVLQKEINKKIMLIMVGGGNKLEELKKRCHEKNVNAIFTGYLNKKEIAKKLHEADFFVHPTLIETFGVVVAEALLTGTPVICSNVGALPELVCNNVNGILCENTVEDWVNGIKQAFAANFDNQKIASEMRNRFSYEIIGKQIGDVYGKLTEGL